VAHPFGIEAKFLPATLFFSIFWLNIACFQCIDRQKVFGKQRIKLIFAA